MPRISRLNRSEVSPELTGVYDKFLHDRGNVPYFFRLEDWDAFDQAQGVGGREDVAVELHRVLPGQP